MITLGDLVNSGNRVVVALQLSRTNYLYPPHIRIIEDLGFQRYFDRNNVLLTPNIGGVILELSLLEASALYSGITSGNLYSLGVLASIGKYDAIVAILDKNYPLLKASFNNGFDVPKLEYFLSLTSEQLKVESVLYPDIINNANFQLMWRRLTRTLSIQIVTSHTGLLNKAVEENNYSYVVLTLSANKPDINDINVDLINTTIMFKTILSYIPKVPSLVLKSYVLFALKREMLDSLLEVFPNALDVRTYYQYVDKTSNPSINKDYIILELNSEIVLSSMHSFILLYKVLNSIKITYDDKVEEKKFHAKWLSEAFSTKNRLIYQLMIDKLKFTDTKVLIELSVLTGNISTVKELVNAYSEPKNKQAMLVNAIKSRSLDMVKFVLARVPRNLPLHIPLSSSAEVLKYILDIMRDENNKLKLDDRITTVRRYAIEADFPYYIINIEKMKVIMENFSHGDDSNMRELLSELSKDVDNSPSALIEISKYLNLSPVDVEFCMIEAGKVLNYKIEWFLAK